MKKRLVKQCGLCLLIALALFVSGRSGVSVLEKGTEAVIAQMSLDYDTEELEQTAKQGVRAASALPDKLNDAVETVTGRPSYGEPMDEKYSGRRASVFAVGSGEVTAVGENETIGKYVRITHGEDGESIYGNLDEVFAEVPEQVKRGQIIGVYDNENEADFYYSFQEFR